MSRKFSIEIIEAPMSNNKQQTAVEWYDNEIGKLFDQFLMGKIKIYDFQNQRLKLEKQAKEMEKKQHKKTWLDSTSQFDNAAEMTFKKDFDEHYNETYGGGEQ